MLLFYVTHSDEESARKLCETLLRERLIACFNLLPVESVYWWHGEKESANEVVTLLKTRSELETEVENRVLELHPYEVPCIIHWEVTANDAYESWIREETRDIS